MTYAFTVPGFVPTSVNALLGMHHMKAHRVKQGDMNVIAHYFRESGIPKATGKRRLSLLYRTPRGRAPDPDNLMKVLLDSLKHAGAIVDDSSRYLETMPPRHEYGERTTVITLEDVEGA